MSIIETFSKGVPEIASSHANRVPSLKKLGVAPVGIVHDYGNKTEKTGARYVNFQFSLGKRVTNESPSFRRLHKALLAGVMRGLARVGLVAGGGSSTILHDSGKQVTVQVHVTGTAEANKRPSINEKLARVVRHVVGNIDLPEGHAQHAPTSGAVLSRVPMQLASHRQDVSLAFELGEPVTMRAKKWPAVAEAFAEAVENGFGESGLKPATKRTGSTMMVQGGKLVYSTTLAYGKTPKPAAGQRL